MAVPTGLQCPICGRVFDPGEVRYACPVCGQVGTLDVLYDYDALRTSLDRERLSASHVDSMWRYRSLLPLGDAATVPTLRVGMTPLMASQRLAEDLGTKSAYVKDDGLNPTGSLKDRASAMIVARALAEGVSTVSTASTGNAAAALAGVGASVGIDVVIFVPASAPEAKIAQLLVYGARVMLVEDTYDVAFDLCFQICEEQGWYCRNTALNPFTTEGKKTVSFEIAEQLKWQVPDVVVVSVGDGNIIAGAHKGFVDLQRLGWIERIPRLIGVQADGSAALFDAWRRGIPPEAMQPIEANTIADSISAGLPRDRAKALRAIRQTAGAFITVSDAEILEAIPRLARLTGVFGEPASAAAYAGAKRAVQSNLIQSGESVLLLLTGNGLKDVRRAQQSVGQGVRVKADMVSVRQALQLK